jgi:integrase
MGAGWTDQDLVFCHADGTMLHPERFTPGILERRTTVGATADPAARPAARMGNARASGGHPPEGRAERLGHANIGITMDTYSHVIAGLHVDAAEQVAAMFRLPVSNPLADGNREASNAQPD